MQLDDNGDDEILYILVFPNYWNIRKRDSSDNQLKKCYF